MHGDKYRTMGPYATKGNQWVSFDDISVIRYKVRLIETLLHYDYFEKRYY